MRPRRREHPARGFLTARFAVAGLLILIGFGPSCARRCPEGYRQEQDVCVTAEAPAHRCSVLPTTKQDPHGGGLLTRVDFLGGNCIWMDQTEVTVGAYRQWVNEVSGHSVQWEPTWCAWKSTPSEPVENAADACTKTIESLDADPWAANKPIRCVDFCDAEAFCGYYAGKRLCYSGGTKGLQGPRNVPREWSLACTNGFETVYPWGDEAADGDCNTSGFEGAYPVGWAQLCRNRHGVADLLGNVAEWTLACNFMQPGQELLPSNCLIWGGGFDQPLQACSVEDFAPNDARRRDLGFRCCSELTVDEEALLIAE